MYHRYCLGFLRCGLTSHFTKGTRITAGGADDWLMYFTMMLFMLIGAGHVTLVIYGLYRMGVRPTVQEKTPYVYSPRTSFTIGRLLKRSREEK